MSSAGISALQYKVELLRELPRSNSGILVKVNEEVSLGFSAWQSGLSINQASTCKILYLCEFQVAWSISVVYIHCQSQCDYGLFSPQGSCFMTMYICSCRTRNSGEKIMVRTDRCCRRENVIFLAFSMFILHS